MPQNAEIVKLFVFATFLLSTFALIKVNDWRYSSANNVCTHLKMTADSSHPQLMYGCLQHVGLIVNDVEQAKRFYIDVFSFSDESHLRPKTLPYPGAFMNIAHNFQIHLMQLPTVDPKVGRPEHGGRDRHVAVTINDIDIIKDRLVARGMPYTMSQSGRRALFCRDIDGNAFEFMEDSLLSQK